MCKSVAAPPGMGNLSAGPCKCLGQEMGSEKCQNSLRERECRSFRKWRNTNHDAAEQKGKHFSSPHHQPWNPALFQMAKQTARSLLPPAPPAVRLCCGGNGNHAVAHRRLIRSLTEHSVHSPANILIVLLWMEEGPMSLLISQLSECWCGALSAGAVRGQGLHAPSKWVWGPCKGL